MKISFFKKGDVEAMFGVLFDGATKVITGAVILAGATVAGGVLTPAELTFNFLMPSLGLGVFLASLYFWYMGRRQAIAQADDSVVAMPGGITAGRFFIWLFVIMLPYIEKGELMQAIYVGIGAHIISGILGVLFSFGFTRIVKYIPSPVLFGALSGGAVAWLTLASLNDMFATPIIAMICLFIVIVMYLGKLKISLSPAILSISVGVVLGFLTGIITTEAIGQATSNIGFHLPGAVLLTEGYIGGVLGGLKEALNFLPIILAFTFGETVSNTQAIEQAVNVGDTYDRNELLVGINIVTTISAVLGNPFPIGFYWGYDSWKKLNAGTGYQLGVGVIYLILGSTGLIALVTSIIPVASVLPILVFIGLSSMAGAFADADKKYYPVMVLALALPITEFVVSKAPDTNLWFLSQGAMLIAIVWGTALYKAIENEYRAAAATMLIGASLAFVGLIHRAGIIFEGDIMSNIMDMIKVENVITAYPTYLIALVYVVLAVILLIFDKFKIADEEQK